MLKNFLILFALGSPCVAQTVGSVNGVAAQSIANMGATETAGAGGVTANTFVGPDTSSPTRFVTAAASACGSGVALSTAAAGSPFTLSDAVGTVLVKTDSGGATAGHLLVASSTTPGLAVDSGQTTSLNISEETAVCGTALTSVSGGGLVIMNPRSRGSYGHKVDQMNGAAPPLSASVLSSNVLGQLVTTPAQAASTVFGNCTSSSGVPAFCAITAGMVPNNAASTTGNSGTASALAATPTVCSAGSAAGGILANGNATGCVAYDASGAATAAQATAITTAEAYSSDASHLASNTVPVARLPVAAGSGSGHAAGVVPDPGAVAGSTKFLREDMTFAVPSGGSSPNIQTAGSGGVTANFLVTEDTSAPTRFILANASSCGAGVAASTAASASTFTLQDLNSGAPIVVAVDAGGVTAGHILIGSTVTAGAVMDSGLTSSSTIPIETNICGVAAANAAGNSTVAMFPRPRGSIGKKVSKINGTTFPFQTLTAPVFSDSLGNPVIAPAQSSNSVYGNCTNSAGAPSFCALTPAMVPNNAASTTGNAATATALAATPSSCPAGQYATGITASGSATGCTAAPVTMLASGASHAGGLVPDPGASAGTTHYLREDGTWTVPGGGSSAITSQADMIIGGSGGVAQRLAAPATNGSYLLSDAVAGGAAGLETWVTGPTGTIVGTTDTQTLTNKSITQPAGVYADTTANPNYTNFITVGATGTPTAAGATTGLTSGWNCWIQHTYAGTAINYYAAAYCQSSSNGNTGFYLSASHAVGAESYVNSFGGLAAGGLSVGAGLSATTGTFSSTVSGTTLKGSLMPQGTVATVASASAVAPTTPIVIFSGTTTIDTITAPSGTAALVGAAFDWKTTSALTFSTAGNIASPTITTVANQAGHCFFAGSTDNKWYCK